MLLGNPWRLKIFPGGHAREYFSLLCNMSDKAIDIDFGFSVSDENGKLVAYERTATPINLLL
jgi:hypothetical protein